MVQPKLVGAVIVIGLLIIIGTVFYYYVENWSWIDSLFFSISYLTTAGHATLVPLTDMGKLFTSVYLLIGVSLALYILIDVLGKHTDTALTNLGCRVTGKK